MMDMERCHPTEPFRCPGVENVCISIQYLCDGARDCKDGYDEDASLCTAVELANYEIVLSEKNKKHLSASNNILQHYKTTLGI
ncbi:low-density lipoprotein receptor-like protein [Leptotrombidium deliense]|uniref:Low-density lipoprotein receptor-like protein n=1 Tax=Leptotrombidium deliense TaxID=299467 RepID=A0A443SV84_9ACAR|nr:low-density lipoprotein receptor-like protein [Leptotrombidium deliense]